jgi:hypothetical protein
MENKCANKRDGGVNHIRQGVLFEKSVFFIGTGISQQVLNQRMDPFGLLLNFGAVFPDFWIFTTGAADNFRKS